MLWVMTLHSRKQESASLITSKMTAAPVIPESGLEPEANMMTPTLVETKRRAHQIMETNTSKPWVTPYNGLYGEAPPERGTFFTFQVYERVETSRVKVYKNIKGWGNLTFRYLKGPFIKIFRTHTL